MQTDKVRPSSAMCSKIVGEKYPRVGKDHLPADCFLNGLHFVFSKSVMLMP
jgi:hypothetical protein